MKKLTLGLLLGMVQLMAQNALYVDLSGEWRKSADDDVRYAQPGFDDSAWQRAQLPWTKSTFGIFWLRRVVELPAGTDTSQLAATLGTVSESYEVFVNGTRIGTTGEFSVLKQQIARPRTFPIPAAAAATDGTLTVAVRVWRPQRYFSSSSWIIFDKGPFLLTYAANAPQDLGKTVIDERWMQWSSDHILSAMQAVLALLLFIAWFTERDRRELLWLSLYLISEVAASTTALALIAEDSFPNLWSSRRFVAPLSVVLLAEFTLATIRLHFRWVRAAIWLCTLWAVSISIALSTQWEQPLYIIFLLTIGMVFLAMWRLAQTSPRLGQFALPVLLVLALISKANRFQTITFINGRPVWGHYAWNIAGLIVIVIASLITFILLRDLMADRREKQRLAGELEAARAVQQLLVPHATANSKDYQTEAVYEPAQEVGGDFHTNRIAPDGSLIVTVGDVSGKGLKAAMLVSVAVGILWNEKSTSPAAILGALNEGLTGHTGGGFVTCCCARFGADGTVTIANAGHPSPYCDDREVEVQAGLPLGIMADVVYDESVVRGRRFTFVSDGVVEAENAKRELFGFDRTREISTKSAHEIAEAAKTWGQNDDITVVTVRKVASS